MKKSTGAKRIGAFILATVMAMTLFASGAAGGAINAYAKSVSDNDISVISPQKNENEKTENDEVKEFSAEGLAPEAGLDETEAEVREAFEALINEFPVLVLVFHTEGQELRENAKGEGNRGSVVIGDQLELLDFDLDNDGLPWYRVRKTDGSDINGWISGAYIVSNDRRFQEWRNEELSKIATETLETEGSSAAEIQSYFPSGYHSGLLALSAAHPEWTFVPINTNQEWSYIVAKEREGSRSLVQLSAEDSWKSKEAGDFDPSTGAYTIRSGSNWVRASETAVAYCLNPLNYLDDQHIFAFEQLTYNPSFQNIGGVEAIIRGTFMDGAGLPDGSGGSYSSTFMEAGALTGVSPYHIASRILQEQGRSGGSELITSSPYNFFNVGASGSNKAQVIANGRARAAREGWNSAYSSILGGARLLALSYIGVGQDTLYLEKFDVLDGRCTHQYMQNIQAPFSESTKTANAYAAAGATNLGFVFRVPVYLNTPGNGDGGGGNPDGGGTKFPVSEKFIAQLYSVVLDRQPDGDGLEYWKAQMANGKTAADLVQGFFMSDEMKNKGLSNELFVAYAYSAILGRSPDEAGRKYWVGELDAGVTRTYILVGFVDSKEFENQCKDYGIIKGSMKNLAPMDINPGMTKFTTRLYKNILGRNPDDDGLNYWTLKLQNGFTGCELIEGFFYSNEFKNKTLTDEQYVDIMYRTLLGREADGPGKEYWLGRIKNEGRGIILSGFAYSQEFKNLCADAGISLGQLTK